MVCCSVGFRSGCREVNQLSRVGRRAFAYSSRVTRQNRVQSTCCLSRNHLSPLQMVVQACPRPLNPGKQSLMGDVRALPTGPPRLPQMRISLPRHDLFGEERWLIPQRRRARSLFLNGLLLGPVCTGIQVKLISHCQAVRIKQ